MKYEYIGEQSITLHGIGEAGGRMSEIELPELPEPDGSASVVAGHEQVSEMTADVVEEVPAWSEPLVLAYARQAVLAERERLATLVEDKVAPSLPPVPEGYALVPIKPTPAMVDVMLDWGTKRSEWEMILRAANPPTDSASEQVRAAILAERERCARVCEAHAAPLYPSDPEALGLLECAAAIRRGSV